MASVAQDMPSGRADAAAGRATNLDHIPGEDGLPILGNTVTLLRDPKSFSTRMRDTYGDVYRTNLFGIKRVTLVGPEANELILFDREKNFSSEKGWNPVLELLFPRGLMLMDFEHHRADRKALSIAFKPGPMRHYTGALNRGIAERVQSWIGREICFYNEIKELSLDLAADAFLGLPLGEEADAINKAFVDTVQASVGVVRKPLPFTQMGRGVAGRKFLVDWFSKETVRRREGEVGQDMFSQFAHAQRDDGSLLAVDEVVDHMIFLMMAAHDTITSSATTLVWQLAKNPEWQEKLRREIETINGGSSGPISYDDLGKFELTEMAFKEALRLVPPVPGIPRQAVRDFEFGGHRIPAGAPVSVAVAETHNDPSIWPDPETFDPMRFTPDQVKQRHKYAWVPFGGGAHMCLGLHFAYMQVKILMAHMLSNASIHHQPGYDPVWQFLPIPRPKDGLKVSLKPL